MKTIKYILLALMLCLSSNLFAQKSLFDKYSDMDDVTTIYISKNMFRMMPQGATAGVNISRIKNKLNSMQIITTEKRSIITALRKDINAFKSSNRQFSELMRIKEGKESTVFLADQRGDLIKNLHMIMDEGDEMTIIQMLGNFTVQDVQQITK